MFKHPEPSIFFSLPSIVLTSYFPRASLWFVAMLRPGGANGGAAPKAKVRFKLGAKVDDEGHVWPKTDGYPISINGGFS